MKKLLFATCCIAFLSGSLGAAAQKKSAAKNVLTQTLKGKSWSADNGNGTFTNPLFYDEFSDPDIIRVGEDTIWRVPRCTVFRDWWCSIPRIS